MMSPEEIEAALDPAFRKRLQRYLYWRCGATADVDEAAQEAMISALDPDWGPPEVENAGALFRAIYARAKANVWNESRRRRRRRCASLDVEQLLDPRPMDLRAFDARAELAHVLAGLTDSERRLVRLKFVRGLPYDEIARELKCDAGSVRVAVHRLRAKLRKRHGVKVQRKTRRRWTRSRIARLRRILYAEPAEERYEPPQETQQAPAETQMVDYSNMFD